MNQMTNQVGLSVHSAKQFTEINAGNMKKSLEFFTPLDIMQVVFGYFSISKNPLLTPLTRIWRHGAP